MNIITVISFFKSRDIWVLKIITFKFELNHWYFVNLNLFGPDTANI